MDINIFQDLFVNKSLSLKKIYITVSIFIISILMIVIFDNEFYDYYEGNATIKDNLFISVVSIYDLKYINNNKNMIIGGSTFSYKVVKIDDYIEGYKIVSIKVNNYHDVDNLFIEYKIIINKDTILDYFIKSMRGNI